MSNQTLFDTEKAQKLKEEGMDRAASNNVYLLKRARFLAEYMALGRPDREVTADDVAEYFLYTREPYGGPWTGSIFKGKEWEFTGRWVKSRRVSNHARAIRVWRYVGKGTR